MDAPLELEKTEIARSRLCSKCGAMFSYADNPSLPCRYHPGCAIEFGTYALAVYDCCFGIKYCHELSENFQHIPGCTRCVHVASSRNYVNVKWSDNPEESLFPILHTEVVRRYGIDHPRPLFTANTDADCRREYDVFKVHGRRDTLSVANSKSEWCSIVTTDMEDGKLGDESECAAREDNVWYSDTGSDVVGVYPWTRFVYAQVAPNQDQNTLKNRADIFCKLFVRKGDILERMREHMEGSHSNTVAYNVYNLAMRNANFDSRR